MIPDVECVRIVYEILSKLEIGDFTIKVTLLWPVLCVTAYCSYTSLTHSPFSHVSVISFSCPMFIVVNNLVELALFGVGGTCISLMKLPELATVCWIICFYYEGCRFFSSILQPAVFYSLTSQRRCATTMERSSLVRYISICVSTHKK